MKTNLEIKSMKFRKIKQIGIGILFVSLFSIMSFAEEDLQQTANQGMPLARDYNVARGMGMASSIVARPIGTESLFWNAAGLGMLEDCMELGLHHNSGLGDSIHETLVFGMPMGTLGGFAASMNFVNNGLFEGRDAGGNKIADYSAGSFGINLGWGKQIFSGIFAGAAIKYNQQSLANMSYTAYAMDLGFIWQMTTKLNLGLVYDNIGSKIADRVLSSGWQVGLSYNIDKDILVLASTRLTTNRFDRIQFGFEGYVDPRLALRAGYVHNITDNNLEGLTGLTAGLGVEIAKDMMFDYGFVPFGELGSSHFLSLTYKFGQKEAVKLKPVVTRLNPNSGLITGGTMVIVSGSGFTDVTGANGVKFNSMNASSYVVNSDTRITAFSPAHTEGTVDVVVTNPVGSSLIVSEDVYTYFKAPVPKAKPMITKIDPGAGTTEGGTRVVITGSGFIDVTGANGIKFDFLKAMDYNVESDTKITAVSPAHAAGMVDVVVTSPEGSSPIVLADTYTYFKPAMVVVLEKLIVLDDTHFEFDKATLTKAGIQTVIENTQILKDNPSVKIRIAGYASASGTEEYNQALSERRAAAVKDILVKEGGIDPVRLTTIGYGETRPAVFEPIPGHINSIEAKANMRVLFEIVVK